MTQLSTSAAYIRKEKLANESALRAALRSAGMLGSVIDEEVWELLETPQTVVSLQRAASQTAVDSASLPDRDYFANMLARLLEADLIELSPDS